VSRDYMKNPAGIPHYDKAVHYEALILGFAYVANVAVGLLGLSLSGAPSVALLFGLGAVCVHQLDRHRSGLGEGRVVAQGLGGGQHHQRPKALAAGLDRVAAGRGEGLREGVAEAGEQAGVDAGAGGGRPGGEGHRGSKGPGGLSRRGATL
jgi:hypothetical protein